MPPSTVKSKKLKTDSGEDDASTTRVKIIDVAPPIINESDPVYYVTLDMRLLNWNYLNFKFRTKTTTRLFAIKQRIQKQHGPILDLKICKEHYSEANELRDDMMTLAEYGITGAADGEPEVVCLIHYDFKPDQYDNPLLLASEEY
ncbi:uncharacterized protein PHALS_11911 [Plasmopara halstedii]|uniref:Ubiquitin-like domain-containing protein n=1 Tax=Plasmopara halstedii TaxID=4781 RepID=A0A0P1ALH4_PLAHL|nr:uncharacterized protein PHALS_11911 [Plasmopara halstedii]CEG41574.1 hypothetical protein PHALS_11911 [Plasmopara halstedii]|eukprot:XP_024577943.1 hypothetical protein PHALS_11911 [Plasmopara halstedii]